MGGAIRSIDGGWNVPSFPTPSHCTLQFSLTFTLSFSESS